MSPEATGGVGLRAVVVAFGAAEYLSRSLPAWETARARAGVGAEIVVVLPAGDRGKDIARSLVPGVRILEVDSREPSTPGANRNRGAAGAAAPLLLFLDGDVELAPDFLERGVRRLLEAPKWAGYGGRIDERHWKDDREAGGAGDLYRVGRGGEVDYLAQAWLCRRQAFEEVGGFDASLPAEEDFELGACLRHAGWKIWAGPELAGTHHCAPRPSLAELSRRWQNGMFAGPGLALKRASGGPLFAELLARQRLYVGSLFFLVAGVAGAALAIAGHPIWFGAWAAVALAAMLVLSVRKRSARLAGMSVLTWMLSGFALVRVWIAGPWGPHARWAQARLGDRAASGRQP